MKNVRYPDNVLRIVFVGKMEYLLSFIFFFLSNINEALKE